MKRLDEVWDRLADFTVANILTQLIKRVTLQPDGARIEVDMAYLYREVAASSLVSFAYRSLAKTRAALSSILAPVCLSPLR